MTSLTHLCQYFITKFRWIVLQKLEDELCQREKDLISLKETAEKLADNISQHDGDLVKEHIR